MLAARLATGDHRRQENTCRKVGCGDPKDCQLHVPGAGQIERQQCVKVNPEKVRDVGSVMLGCSPRRVCARKRRAMTRKNHAQARCAGVNRTSPGGLKETVRCSAPCQPRNSHRPKANSRMPMPPSKAISESTLHTTMSAVAWFPTNASGGQLLV